MCWKTWLKLKTKCLLPLRCSLPFEGKYMQGYQINAIKCCECGDISLSRWHWGRWRGNGRFSPILHCVLTRSSLLDEGINQIAWSRRSLEGWWGGRSRKGKKSTCPPTGLWDNPTNSIKASRNGVTHLWEQPHKVRNRNALKLLLSFFLIQLLKNPQATDFLAKTSGAALGQRENFLPPTPKELSPCLPASSVDAKQSSADC